MPIYKNNTASVISETVESEQGQKRTFNIKPGESVTTEFVLLDANLTVVSASPYYNPLMKTATVTSTGPGDDQTHLVDRETKLITIFNSSVYATAFIRSKSNTPGLPLPANTMRELSVGCNCNQIIFEFSAAGSVIVEERK